jgi:hypothetical protein
MMNRDGNPTRQVVTALAWEFWAGGWRALLGVQLLLLLMPGFVHSLIPDDRDWSRFRAGESNELFYFVFFWPTVICLGIAVLAAAGNPRQRYARPTSSLLLVAVPMACGMVTMFAQYGLVALMVQTYFNAKYPILASGMLAALVIAVCQAVLWSTSNAQGLRMVAGTTSCATLIYCTARWAPLYDPSLHRDLYHIAELQIVGFLLATGVCVGLGTWGFGRLRHGSVIGFKRIIEWLSERYRRWQSQCTTPIASPWAALCSLEWAERGYALPMATTLIGLFSLPLASHLSAIGSPKNASESGLLLSTLFALPLLLIGFFWGSRSATFEFGHFGGSRPVSDRQIAGAVLRSATCGMFVSATIWVVFMILDLRIFALHVGPGFFSGFQPRERFGVWCLTVLSIWSSVSLVTSLALAGRRALIVACGVIVGFWTTTILLGHYFGDRVAGPFVLICLFLCVVGCAALFGACWTRRLISPRTLLLAALLVAGAMIAVRSGMRRMNVEEFILALDICSLIPIPLAAAPMAVYVNRHR